MDEKTQRNVVYWIVGVLLIATVQHWLSEAGTVAPVPYSEFERYLEEGKIADVLISDLEVTGRLKKPDPNGKEVIVATGVEPDLAAQLSKYKVRFTRVIETGFVRDLLSWVIPAFVLLPIWKRSVS
jgi:cell division protease FtsH